MSTKKPSSSASEPALKTFADHLGELRTRLAWVALVLIVSSALAYNVRELLVSFILSPIGHQKLVYLTPAGGFAFIFQLSMYAGLIVTAPVAIYHLYRFIAPALPVHMRQKSVRIVLISTALMLLGVGFGYFVAIPAALQFLTAFGGDFVTANLTADSYLNFVTAYLLGLGILFQLPLLLVIWNWIKPFKPGGLLSTQRYVLVGSFIAAAMITPTPDALNQSMIALPIVAIYQLGVIAVFVMNRRNLRQVSPHRGGAVRKPIASELPHPHMTNLPGALIDFPAVVDKDPSSLQPAVQAPAPVAPQAAPLAIEPLPRAPRRSMDGFARGRTTSVGPILRGHQARPVRTVTRGGQASIASARRRATVDGF